MLVASVIAALVLELDGEGLLLVLVPVDELDEVAAADDDEEDEEVRVAELMVVFRDMAVPVAAEPDAPVPTAAGAVVVALPEEEVPLLLEPPPTTPPEAGFMPTVEVALTEALVEVDDEEARAETARLGPLVEPPVRVIIPV